MLADLFLSPFLPAFPPPSWARSWAARAWRSAVDERAGRLMRSVGCLRRSDHRLRPVRPVTHEKGRGSITDSDFKVILKSLVSRDWPVPSCGQNSWSVIWTHVSDVSPALHGPVGRVSGKTTRLHSWATSF